MRSLAFKKVRIPLASPGPGVDLYTFFTKLPADAGPLQKQFPNEIQIEVKVDMVEDEYLVTMTVKTESTLQCDRCLADFTFKCEATLITLYTFDESKTEGNEGDIKLLPPGSADIDLTEDICDALALSVPEKLLCKKDCRGLCAGCGTNLNESSCTCKVRPTDTRWDALKNIKFE